jgi:hypothetical protein
VEHACENIEDFYKKRPIGTFGARKKKLRKFLEKN